MLLSFQRVGNVKLKRGEEYKRGRNGEACSRSKRDCTHHNHNIRGVGDFRHTHTEICKVK